jgi:hypothetical protein
MELAGLGKRNMLVVPTPGQPEQEYLAEHLAVLKIAATQAQENLDLNAGFRQAMNLPGFTSFFQNPETGSLAWTLADWIREHPLFHAPKRLAGKFVL